MHNFRKTERRKILKKERKKKNIPQNIPTLRFNYKASYFSENFQNFHGQVKRNYRAYLTQIFCKNFESLSPKFTRLFIVIQRRNHTLIKVH